MTARAHYVPDPRGPRRHRYASTWRGVVSCDAPRCSATVEREAKVHGHNNPAASDHAIDLAEKAAAEAGWAQSAACHTCPACSAPSAAGGESC